MKNEFYSNLTKSNCGYINLSAVNQFKIYINKKTTIIIALTIIIISFLNISCKTCKCPAYSQIEIKINANTGDSTV
jgi:hypothetical protein